MLVIGLGYQARQGKDTLADFLIKARGPHSPFRLTIFKTSFAAPLKREVNNAVAYIAQGFRYVNTTTLPDFPKFLEPFVAKRIWHEPPPTGPKGLSNGAMTDYAMEFICWAVGVEYDRNPPMNDPLCPFGKQRRLLQWWGTEFRRAQDPTYWTKRAEDQMNTLREEKVDVAIVTDVRFPNEIELTHHLGGVTICVQRVGYEEAPAQGHSSEQSLTPSMFDYQVKASQLMGLKLRGLRVFDEIVQDRV